MLCSCTNLLISLEQKVATGSLFCEFVLQPVVGPLVDDSWTMTALCLDVFSSLNHRLAHRAHGVRAGGRGVVKLPREREFIIESETKQMRKEGRRTKERWRTDIYVFQYFFVEPKRLARRGARREVATQHNEWSNIIHRGKVDELKSWKMDRSCPHQRKTPRPELSLSTAVKPPKKNRWGQKMFCPFLT